MLNLSALVIWILKISPGIEMGRVLQQHQEYTRKLPLIQFQRMTKK